jgi:hypothetical protein
MTIEEVYPDYVKSIDRTEDTSEVDTLVLFIGHAFTGHTLVRAILDAHPQIVISDEFNVASRVHHDNFTSREHMLEDILRMDAEGWEAVEAVAAEQTTTVSEKHDRLTKEGWNPAEKRVQTFRYPGHDYRIHNSAQGKVTTSEQPGRMLRVVGDKRAHDTTTHLAHNPGLLDAIRGLFGGRIVLIHVVRNPMDTIATACQKGNRSPVDECRRYREMIELNDWIIEAALRRPQVDVWTMHHGDLLADAPGQIMRLLHYLLPIEDQDPEAQLTAVRGNRCVARAASRLVNTKPHRTCHEAPESGRRAIEKETALWWERTARGQLLDHPIYARYRI